MDGQQYLDQIAPVKTQRGGITSFLRSKLGIFIIGSLVAIVAMLIFGVTAGNQPDEKKAEITALKDNLANFSQVASNYESGLEASSLRNSANDLLRVLSITSRNLNDFITQKYGTIDTVSTEENTYFYNLDVELFAANAGQFFDRAYARKIALAIDRLMTAENSIYDKVDDSTLQNLLAESYNSLSTLYDQFNNYSE